MNALTLLVRHIEQGSNYENLKPYILQAQNEIASLKIDTLKLSSIKSSALVPDHLLAILATLEHVSYKASLPLVLVVCTAYIQRNPAILDALEGFFPAVPANIEAQKITEDVEEKQEENANNAPTEPEKKTGRRKRHAR